MKRTVITSLIISALALMGWNSLAADAKKPSAASSGDKLSNAQVKALYKKNCASCHGKDGRGKTKMGRKMKAKNYADPKVWALVDDKEALKNAKDKAAIKKIKDQEALKKIKNGIKDKKTGKPRMKPYAKKLNDDQIKALIAYMRTFTKKPKK